MNIFEKKLQNRLRDDDYSVFKTDDDSNKDEESQNILELKGKKIDLKRLKINFKLNDQQQEVLNKLTDFLIDKEELAFCLSGYAGTGKTSIIKILLKWLDVYYSFYDYEITAPTHRAKNIIESLSGKKSKTIHSILGLMPNIDVEKLDHRNIKFDNSKKPQIPKNLLILDESSMVNDFLYKLIIEKCQYHNCQILFIGDKAQLKPVKQKHISKVFATEARYELTKVERQKDGNPLGSILLNIRNNMYSEEPSFEFQDELNSKGEGMICVENSTAFLNNAVQAINNVVYYNDYLHSRILAFQNDRVKLYNKLIRKRIGFENEYMQGELLMAYANVGSDDFGGSQFVNSCDYIIENKPYMKRQNFLGTELIGYEIDLVSTDERSRLTQFVVSYENDEKIINEVAFQIEELRFMAINETQRHKRIQLWREYYSIMNNFINPMDFISEGRVIKPKSVDYGYSHTVHKSQGGTYKQVYVDYRDISRCFDIEQRNQLCYVALSRATDTVTLFH